MDRRAKIVATLGPATRDEKSIRQLILSGVNIFRLNFSHGTHEDHGKEIEWIRMAAADLKRSVSILQDLQGPKIRTGEIQNDGIALVPGQKLILTTKSVLGDEKRISVDYPGVLESVSIGGRILLDDGKLELVVRSISQDSVETEVVLGGVLKSHKGVNLPGASLSIQAFTDKDQQDLEFVLFPHL